MSPFRGMSSVSPRLQSVMCLASVVILNLATLPNRFSVALQQNLGRAVVGARNPFVFETTTKSTTRLNDFSPRQFLDFVESSLPGRNDGKRQPGDATAAVLANLNITKSREPRRFYARPEQLPNLLTASFPALLRLGSGVFGNGYQVGLAPKEESTYTLVSVGDGYQLEEKTESGRTQQVEPLILYEFEGCPFCRKLREAVSILGLEVTFRPCPQDGRIYRTEIKAKYGSSATFPFLQDPNTGVSMFESDDIISYLFKTYGDGNIPWTLSSENGPVVTLTAGVGLLFRFGRGSRARPSNPPLGGNTDTTTPPVAMPLTLWAYEGSPFCKVVREVLCELEIPHTQISCPRGSPNRQRMVDELGRFQVPYLEDPNVRLSGGDGVVKLWESDVICEYLEKQYAVDPSPVKYL